MKAILYTITSFLAISLMSCSSGKKTAEEDVETEINDEVTAPLELDLPVSKMYTVYGHVKTRPSGKIDYYSMTDAFIEKLEIYDGMKISKGSMLYTAKAPDMIQTQQDYMTAKITMDWAKSELERMDTLLKSNAVSRKEYKAMEKEYALNRSNYEALKQELYLVGISPSLAENGKVSTNVIVRSKVDGIVEKVHVNAGAKVGRDQLVVSVLNKDALVIELMVDRNIVKSLHVGDTLSGNLNSSQELITMSVSAIAYVTTSESNKVRVECSVMDNAEVNYGDVIVVQLQP